MNIESKILSDPTISYGDRMALIDYVKDLSFTQKNQLESLTSTAIGAGVGALVAKFLLGLGIKGTIISSILGGLIGHSFSTPSVTYFDPIKNSGLSDGYGRYY